MPDRAGISRALPRLVLMHGPGIGPIAFRRQVGLPARIEIPRWLPHPRGQSIEHYARRMAQTIDPTPPLYLGGLSFGGMVALEMARYLKPEAVILIASGHSGRQVLSLLWPLQKLVPYIPLWFYRLSRHWLPPLLRLGFIAADRTTRDLLVETLKNDVDFDSWRNGIESITRWELKDRLPVPVYHIHGRADWLMPIWKVSPDAVVPGAPHLMNISHPDAVNEFIAACLRMHGQVHGPRHGRT
jgi:pimeloyl-ACP methyl ester carboxylesterase